MDQNIELLKLLVLKFKRTNFRWSGDILNEN